MTSTWWRSARQWPAHLSRAPRWVPGVIGVALLAIGLFLLVRPLTALTALGLLIGIGCLISGVADLATRGRPTAIGVVTSIAWIALGALILLWLGDSIYLLVPAVAAVLIISGFGRIIRYWRHDPTRTVWTLLLAAIEIAWGLIALLWPDVTLVTLAVLFGVRTVFLGLTLLRRSIRPSAAQQPSAPGTRPSTGRRFAVTTAALATVLVSVIGVLVQGGQPDPDGFYDAPATVPGTPGALVRTEPYEGDVPDGVRAYRILYTTTDSAGAPALSSGVLAVPENVDGPVPLIAWAHGTVGVARGCAPSIGDDAVSTVGIPMIDLVVDRGWAVVATDYTGMGAAGNFPYLVGSGEARSILDSIRAAHAFTDVSFTDRTVLWGHSQGGHAVEWAGMMAPDYAPELDIAGTAAISPASDPQTLAQLVVDHPESVGTTLAISFVAEAYSKAYPDDLSLNETITPAARPLVREAASRCLTQTSTIATILTGLAVSRDRPILRESPTSGPLADYLSQNIARGPWAAPLFIGQGEADEVVPITQNEQYVSDLCAQGIPVTFHGYPDRTHVGVLAADSPLMDDLLPWTADRFAGRESADTCAAPSR